jgi:hypothetical protein
MPDLRIVECPHCHEELSVDTDEARARAEVLAEVEGLRALSDAGDDGPWSWDGIGGGRLRTPKRAIADLRYSHNAANADLIVSAVNLVRALLAVAPTAGPRLTCRYHPDGCLNEEEL